MVDELELLDIILYERNKRIRAENTLHDMLEENQVIDFLTNQHLTEISGKLRAIEMVAELAVLEDSNEALSCILHIISTQVN